MLRPIPQQLLRSVVTLKVCTAMDEWQTPTWEEHTVKRVHLQDTNEIRKTVNNTEVTLKVCTAMDEWQTPTWEEYTVKRVHLQDTDEIRKTANNTEVTLSSILFVDSRLSTPQLDYQALLAQSLEAGKPMRAVVENSGGKALSEYEVLTVDLVPDACDGSKIHHIELGLV